MFEAFLNGFVDFLTNNTAAILFYGAIILAIYWFREKLHWEGKFIGLYKTKIGVKLMKTIATRFPRAVRGIGYVGIPVGYLGMAAIMYVLIRGLWDILFTPSAPQVIGLVLPGVHIPGLSIAIPLITGWLALFVVIVVHEFSHGVVSKAHGIPIKSSGLLFFGPLLGAFVEPDEKKLSKAKDSVQLSIFAAGPWSNVLSAILFIILSTLVATAASGMIVADGIEVLGVNEGSPAEMAGLEPGMIIVGAQGLDVTNSENFKTALGDIQEGDSVTLVSKEGNEYALIAGTDGDPATTAGKIGIDLQSKSSPASDSAGYLTWLSVIFWVLDFFKWVVLLNLGLGLANLLPLGPVDGGRMMHTAQIRFFGKKRGEKYWKNITVFTIVLLVLVLLLPLIL